MDILRTDIYCVLCGGPFDLEPSVYNLDPQNDAYQWLYSVRLLSTVTALSNLCMSSGDEKQINMSGDDEVFLSDSTRWAVTDADVFLLGNSYYQVLMEDHNGDLIFPLHCTCIDIACMVGKIHPNLDANSQVSSPVGQLLSRLRFQYHHCKYFAGLIGNDIFDLSSSYAMHGPKSLLAIDELDWWGDCHEKFLTDPVEVPNLAAFVIEILKATPQRTKCLVHVNEPVRTPQSLERFPNETLDRISDFLPPCSIINLHKTSKALAQKVPLDDRFWRMHLRDGSLLPHMWDLDTQELDPSISNKKFANIGLWDWKSLIQLLFKKEFPVSGLDSRIDQIPPGFWNRCRIWRIVEEIYSK
ncbi:hypothetical protein B0J11DRAFT_118239 [Dendryphion nanum]|uniref:F-box domain-containing protein n=1 Tax=Dendryphion nanum TaxID=256645 RepID=A0A9P9DBU0_9PLEO|nr:hypothetical protein B0J11DRAFT_118239 [Dendryphion nanum]